MGQVIALDTSLFVYQLEGDSPFTEEASVILLSIEKGGYKGIFASIGVLELLVKPKKLGREDIVEQYKSALANFPHLQVINLNEAIIDRAADLRARYGLRTPDAIHLATAIVSKADVFVTNDKSLTRVKEIKVRLLQGAKKVRN